MWFRKVNPGISWHQNVGRDGGTFPDTSLFHNFHYIRRSLMSAADVKMKIPVLVGSLRSGILSSTSFQMGKTFWGVVSAAVEQSRRKVNMVAQGDGKFGP